MPDRYALAVIDEASRDYRLVLRGLHVLGWETESLSKGFLEETHDYPRKRIGQLLEKSWLATNAA
jgi:hypothetical protein